MNILFPNFLFLWLYSAAVLTASVLADSSSNLSTDIATATDAELGRISFWLYTNKTTAEYTSVLIGNVTDLLPQMILTNPTVFYISGWTEIPESESVQTVLGAYLERGDHNIILANWQEIAAGSYPFAVASAEKVGKTIAGGIDQMVASGLNSNTIHVIAHSLGTHVASFVGENVNISLGRITGLDPAGPAFDDINADLTSTDAKFVDVIHTDAGFYGTAVDQATVDFYPNGGIRVQPGCPSVRVTGAMEDFCDHQKSWRYYAESLLKEEAFIGVQCNSKIEFESGLCSSNEKVIMGYATPTTARGKFYLETNDESPYGRGEAGET